MNAIEPPDSHHLRAVIGWLGLCNLGEAREELKQINPQLWDHPEVLGARFEVCAAAKEWEEALTIAETIIKFDADSPQSWINRSNALHYLTRYQEAYDLLQPALEKFPLNSSVRYNLACYCSRMGRFPEARKWLNQALAMKGGEMLKRFALEDPDLLPLLQSEGQA